MSPRRQIYRGVFMQRGSGIGVIISSIFRALVPWIKRGATTLLKSSSVRNIAKKAGKSVLKSAGSMAASKLNKALAGKVDLKRARKGIQSALTAVGLNEGSPKPTPPGEPVAKKKRKVLAGKVSRYPAGSASTKSKRQKVESLLD